MEHVVDKPKPDVKRRLVLSKWEAKREEERDFENEIANRDWQIEQLESALVAVKYWMHDGLVLHKGVRDPRPLLRKIEDALR